MNILFTIDENFIEPLAVCLFSIQKQHSENLNFHIYTNAVNEAKLYLEKNKLILEGNNYHFNKINKMDFSNYPIDRHASEANYYRLVAIDKLSEKINKVLYLDVDTIIRKPLQKLYNLDLANNIVGAVQNDTKSKESYFNSGVLLIDLKKWDKLSITDRAIKFIQEHPDKIDYWDQDALNFVLKSQWLELPRVYNSFTHSVKDITSVVILHFVGSTKPWNIGHNDNCSKIYQVYKEQMLQLNVVEKLILRTVRMLKKRYYLIFHIYKLKQS